VKCVTFVSDTLHGMVAT